MGTHKLTCGTCETNEICSSNVCKTCTPTTCASGGKNCGTLDDGCGNKLTCGTCQTNEICSSNVCKTCVPKTCASLERACGTIDDGCGKKVTCSGCAASQVCLANGSCCQPAPCSSGGSDSPTTGGKASEGCGCKIGGPTRSGSVFWALVLAGMAMAVAARARRPRPGPPTSF